MTPTNEQPNAPTKRRVLIIGLDGVTWDVLTPLVNEGRLPNIKRAIENGAWGVLQSTTPPITPAAWTTFLTGVQPGKHGIIDFERYDVSTNKLTFNSTRCLDHLRNIWRILGDNGLKVGSVNVPMTYPPVEVNGFLVSGFETPGPSADFVYPPSLRGDILERWPDPTLKTKWRRKMFGGDALFAQNLDYMSRSFHQGAAMTKFLGDKCGWDALMVVFKLTDNIQHKTWKYIDPRWSDRNPKRTEMVKQCFAESDKAVGDLMKYAEENDATVMMVSDHGHGSLEGKVQPNLLLKQWGYLSLDGGSAQGGTRLRYLLDRWTGKTKRFAREGSIAQDLAVDFDKTRACIMHAGMAGFVYLNLKGRQPCGIVEPSEYDSLRDEIQNKFMGPACRTTDPTGQTIQLFSAAHKPEELYNCSREDQPWMPDLILIPRDSLAVVRKIRGTNPVKWLSYNKIEGTHRPQGIFTATGPGIATKDGMHAQIADCAPTILALLGLPIPEDMDGRVLTEIFEDLPELTYETATGTSAAQGGEQVYSEEELQQVTDRLADLGYLE
jgi:predicted AlkP superfamily phosphohydrolase/phosphomutase